MASSTTASSTTAPSTTAPSRRGRPARAVAVLACLLGAGSVALAGCGDVPSNRITPSVATAAAPPSAAAGKDPATVLQALATQLHTDLEGLRSGLPVRTVTTLIDERQACQLGDDWPAQWIFDQRLYLDTSDARPVGRSVTQRYAAQGWVVQAQPSVEGTDQYTLAHGGFVISLGAGSADGSLNLQTSGPCVGTDGVVATASPH